MKNTIFSPRFIFVSLAIIAAASIRLFQIPNFSAIGALALFAGACMPRRWQSLLIPFGAMIVTDILLAGMTNTKFLHETIGYVYGSFALITFIGWYISKKQNVLTIGAAAVVSSVLFFIITNAAMYFTGYYNNLWLALEMGLPYYQNTFISDLLFSGILFGAYHFVRIQKPALVQA
jgi:hypothetical protein